MTDGGGTPSLPTSRRPALGLRLALAFISVALAAVALAAVALVAGLTAGFAAADVSALAARQHAELANARDGTVDQARTMLCNTGLLPDPAEPTLP